MNLTLIPGQGISEPELAEELKISRTPVREALILLEQEALVVIQPKRKTIVSKIDMKKVQNAIFVRATLEQEILRMVVQTPNQQLVTEMSQLVELQKLVLNAGDNLSAFYALDNQFHLLIYEAVEKEAVWSMIEGLSTHYNRFRQLNAIENISLSDVFKQHRELIDLIQRQDASGIETFINGHIKDVSHHFNEVYQKHSDYFVAINE